MAFKRRRHFRKIDTGHFYAATDKQVAAFSYIYLEQKVEPPRTFFTCVLFAFFFKRYGLRYKYPHVAERIGGRIVKHSIYPRCRSPPFPVLVLFK